MQVQFAPSLAMSACPTVSKLYCTGFLPITMLKTFSRRGLVYLQRKGKSPFSGSEDGLGQGLGQAVDQSREGKPLHRLAHGEGLLPKTSSWYMTVMVPTVWPWG